MACADRHSEQLGANRKEGSYDPGSTNACCNRPHCVATDMGVADTGGSEPNVLADSQAVRAAGPLRLVCRRRCPPGASALGAHGGATWSGAAEHPNVVDLLVPARCRRLLLWRLAPLPAVCHARPLDPLANDGGGVAYAIPAPTTLLCHSNQVVVYE